MKSRSAPRIHLFFRCAQMPVATTGRRGFLIMMALLYVQPLVAQTEDRPTAKPDDIVVIARDKHDLDQQIGTFVRALTPTLGNDPLARFDADRLCPQAIGLGPQYDRAITKRMRQVAAAARMDVAREDCSRANAVVIFADDKAAMVALLRKRYPQLFLDVHGDPMKLRKEDGPAVAWHVNELVTRDGVPLMKNQDGRFESKTSSPASRLQALVRPVFRTSFLVIERRGVAGLTVTQIADYAAMRAFADAKPARIGETGAPTILTVLDAPMGSETPMSLTAWDLNFLRALYATPANSFANAQRGAISRYMKQQLDTSGAARK